VKEPVKAPKSRPVSEMTEDEQLQLAMNASMGDVPVVIDDVVAAPAVEPDVFESIVGKDVPEPEGADTTRIQFRCPGTHTLLNIQTDRGL
jgi:hypothetical protein